MATIRLPRGPAVSVTEQRFFIAPVDEAAAAEQESRLVSTSQIIVFVPHGRLRKLIVLSLSTPGSSHLGLYDEIMAGICRSLRLDATAGVGPR